MKNITILQLLLPNSKNSSRITLDVSESKKDFNELQEKIKQRIQEGQWDSVQDKIFSNIDGLLNTPLAPILANSWNKFKEVYQTIEKQKESGNAKPQIVSLLNHEIKSTHNPKLQIYFNDQYFYMIPLVVTLNLELKGVELVIQEGSIKDIKSGSCKGKGEVTHLKAKLLDSKIFEFSLSGQISLSKNEEIYVKQLDLIDQIEKKPEEAKQKNSSGGCGFIALGILLAFMGVLAWYFLRL